MFSIQMKPSHISQIELPKVPTCDECGMIFGYRAMVIDHKRRDHGFTGDSPHALAYARMVQRRITEDPNEKTGPGRFSLGAGSKSKKHSSAPSTKKARTNGKAGPLSAPAKLASRTPMRNVSKTPVEMNKNKRRTPSSLSTPRIRTKKSERATTGAAPHSAPTNIPKVISKSPIEKKKNVDRSTSTRDSSLISTPLTGTKKTSVSVTNQKGASTEISSKNILTSNKDAENIVLKEDEEAVKRKLHGFFRRRVINYFNAALGIEFNNIFYRYEGDEFRKRCLQWKGIPYTMPAEKYTEEMIDSAAKDYISELMTEVISSRRMRWNEEFKKYAPHCHGSYTMAPYRFAISISADCNTLIYRPFINRRHLIDRELSDQEEKEVAAAKKILNNENWSDDNYKMERESFFRVKTLANPEYLIAMSILEGGLEKEVLDMWKKIGTKTLNVSNNIWPNQMHQWILHRMRKKEVSYINELGLWLAVFAETEKSKDVNVILMAAIRAAIGE